MKWVWWLFGSVLLVACGSASALLMDYPVSLLYADSRLSTLLWFRPAYCLYEQWTREALDPSQVSRQTAMIQVEVKPAGDNGTYKIAQKFAVPRCNPMMSESFIPGDLVYEMGPNLVCLNDTCTKAVLPDRSYRVRYCLYNQAQSLLATTNWSQPFYTRVLPRSFRTIDVDSGGHSGGMMAITVLLSLTIFLLWGAVGAALARRKR